MPERLLADSHTPAERPEPPRSRLRPARRPSKSKLLTAAIKRAGGRCVWCQVQLRKKTAVLDLLVPVEAGARAHDMNYCASCKNCARHRDDMPAGQWALLCEQMCRLVNFERLRNDLLWASRQWPECRPHASEQLEMLGERGTVSPLERRQRRLSKLLARDGHRCVWCGLPLSANDPRATFDHAIPKAHGGTSALDNLLVACHSCNLDRGDTPLRAWLELCLDAGQQVNARAVEAMLDRVRNRRGGLLQNLEPSAAVFALARAAREHSCARAQQRAA